jgi:hypothetical protein
MLEIINRIREYAAHNEFVKTNDALDDLEYMIKALLTERKWQKIETAPKDFTEIYAVAIGLDGRPMYALVRWGCGKHVIMSGYTNCPNEIGCDMRWLGSLGMQYGVPFKYWLPCPTLPIELLQEIK